ncbi:hypothetical protein V496_02068 [Pseudogymnoascus sp. VKM F-4515 (FW-2607)]|nr:hypothetical protein V496_02068 [Pseudogymnoascus sp. VKM F-4515 (FW-2607)]KFY69497.1 hypothetical protein V498_10459 [Pseudogymnoascus sp. VKM F-4517 (FW-2822)]
MAGNGRMDREVEVNLAGGGRGKQTERERGTATHASAQSLVPALSAIDGRIAAPPSSRPIWENRVAPAPRPALDRCTSSSSAAATPTHRR